MLACPVRMIIELTAESLTACADGSCVADASLGAGAAGDTNPVRARQRRTPPPRRIGASRRAFAKDCDTSSRASFSAGRAPPRLQAVSSAAIGEQYGRASHVVLDVSGEPAWPAHSWDVARPAELHTPAQVATPASASSHRRAERRQSAAQIVEQRLRMLAAPRTRPRPPPGASIPGCRRDRCA